MAQSRSRFLRFSLALIGAATLGACGGGGDPPPTGPGGSAATVSAFAGTGQTVAAGEDAPIAPAVIVRDAQGQPFAGATVQFSVTGGGGSLAGASQRSDASGVARVTRWTVGTAGPQRVTATVGTLTPVLFEATLGQASETITKAVPSSGGVVTIATNGHPYQGLTLTIAPGTFAATANWTLRVRTDLTLPALPPGYRVGGPILEFTTDAPRGGALMTLDVPLGPAAGEGLVLAYLDPARGVMEVLPTVAQSPTSTRVVTKHLRADVLLGAGSVGGVRTLLAQAGAGSTTGALVPIVFSLPQPAVANVTSDRWPVVDYGSVAFPGGFGAAIPAIQTVAAISNTTMGSIVKKLSTPGFYADAGILGAVQDVASSPGIDGPGLAAIFAQFAGTPKPKRDDLVFQNITASLALTSGPTLAAFFPAISGPTPTNTVYANPIGSSMSGLTAAVPTQTMDGTLGKVIGGFEPMVAKFVGDAPSTTVDFAVPLPSFLFDFTKPMSDMQIIKQYDGVSLGQRQTLNKQHTLTFGLPQPTLELEAVPGGGWFSPEPGTTQTVRGDDLKIRVAGGGATMLGAYDAQTGQQLASDNGSGVDIAQLMTGSNPLSLIMSTSGMSAWSSQGPEVQRQMTMGLYAFAFGPFKVSPDTAHITADSKTVQFDAPVVSPPSGGFRIDWDWGDGTTSEFQNTTTATHQYSTAGDYTVKVTLRSADGTSVRAEYFSYVRSSSPHWRLTSMENADTLDLNVPILIAQVLQQAIQSPSSAMIAVDTFGLSTLSLRINTTGAWTTSNCCGGPIVNETTQFLGTIPTFTLPGAGSRFTDYSTRRWSQSTSDLDAGTMDGQYPKGSFSYEFRPPLGPAQPPITQTGPEYVVRITATRNGTAMSGVITFYYWPLEDPIPGESAAYYDEFPDSYSFPFTAVRIK